MADIKSVINDAKMRRVGWLRAGITLIRATIIPSIAYSSDVWLSANKATEKYVTDEFKSMIYMILDIKTHTKFSSVLADLRLPNITAVIDKQRINFVNHTLWGKGDPMLREMLLEERRLLPANWLNACPFLPAPSPGLGAKAGQGVTSRALSTSSGELA